MTRDRYAKYGAATGILAVILTVGGFALIPTFPDVDASATEVASYYAEEQDGIQVGLVTITVGLFFFIWFLGSVRTALERAEGAPGRLASVAFAGGVLSAAALFALLTLVATAAFHPEESSPEVTTALNDAAVVSGGPAAAGLAALLGAAALVVLRTATYPNRLGALLVVAALAQPLAFGAMMTDGGAFAGDGILGLYVPILSFSVAILALSLALIRDPGGAPAPAASTPTG